MHTLLLAVLAVAGVVFENENFRFEIGPDAKARSLVVKASGEELLDTTAPTALFTSTQDRPFNNEIKLANPNKRTTYVANRIRREGDRLIVGFDVAPYEAVVRAKMGNGYVAFTLEKFITDTQNEHQYGGLRMDVPPVVDFRIAQLAVKSRKNFGDWLNVMWDDKAAVAVIAADPYVDIDDEEERGYRRLRADLHDGIEVEGGTAAVIVGAGPEPFLEGVREVEEDFDLPKGVASRRSGMLNSSIYWVGSRVTPKTVDEEIAFAKQGGFKMMLLYFPCFLKDGAKYGYGILGDYDWNEEYPNGEKDVKAVLDKIHAAGITPGLHTLQTHIGFHSRYVTPVADARLNKKRRFTLAKAISGTGEISEIEVCENPARSPMAEGVRILQFDGELFEYAGYTKTRPWKFTGVKRGSKNTRAQAHNAGCIGGVLDVSEFGAISCYIDQNSDLQDEVGRKIAKICDQGMEFCYFDGSEGVNPPCGINVALAQYRVTSKFKKPPIFTEGAAKSHFGWHLQAGANAFDIFVPEVFKAKIIEYPFAEAPMMRRDFTRLDFGWWALWLPGADDKWTTKKTGGKPTIGTQMDMWEFGTSKAAAWDCPVTIQVDSPRWKKHPRINDIMAVMKRWEDVRAKNFLTAAMKEQLKDAKKEFHLVEKGDTYALVEWRQLAVAGDKNAKVRAFVYTFEGRTCVAYWHTHNAGAFTLANGEKLTADNLKVYSSEKSEAEVAALFVGAKIEK